jgi:hypothetical protein
MMQESIIKIKNGSLIGYVLERDGTRAKVRVTGSLPSTLANEDILKIAEEGALERVHLNGSVIDIDNVFMVVPINKI